MKFNVSVSLIADATTAFKIARQSAQSEDLIVVVDTDDFQFSNYTLRVIPREAFVTSARAALATADHDLSLTLRRTIENLATKDPHTFAVFSAIKGTMFNHTFRLGIPYHTTVPSLVRP